MMTIREFSEIMRKDEALRNEYFLAEKEGKIDIFFREHDVDATAQSIKDLYNEKVKCKLDDSELETVSGGQNNYSTCHTASTVNNSGTESSCCGSDTCHTASTVRKTPIIQKKKSSFWWWLW
jgi:hypothetical protein